MLICYLKDSWGKIIFPPYSLESANMRAAGRNVDICQELFMPEFKTLMLYNIFCSIFEVFLYI